MRSEIGDKQQKKCNVLWVVDHMGYKNVVHGPGNYFLNMIPMLNPEKFNVILCVLRGEKYHHSELLNKGYKVYYLGKGKIDFLTIPELLRIIKNEKIDLLHLNGYGSSNFGRIVAMIKGLPNIVESYDEDMNYPLIQKFSDIILRNKTTKAIAVSEAVKNSCINKRNIPENKVLVIHTGISPDKFDEVNREESIQLKNEYNLNQDYCVIGTLARLREEKGVRYIIEAAAEVLKIFPKVYFFIAGDGPLANELLTLAKELNIQDKIIFAGFCKNAKIVLSILDIYLQPSLKEGFSASIQEAMAQKKPIIATDVGGTPEMLEHDVSGILIPPENSEIMSKKIIYLLNDQEKRKQLGINAFEKCRKWGLDVLVNDLEQLYSHILNENTALK